MGTSQSSIKDAIDFEPYLKNLSTQGKPLRPVKEIAKMSLAWKKNDFFGSIKSNPRPLRAIWHGEGHGRYILVEFFFSFFHILSLKVIHTLLFLQTEKIAIIITGNNNKYI